MEKDNIQGSIKEWEKEFEGIWSKTKRFDDKVIIFSHDPPKIRLYSLKSNRLLITPELEPPIFDSEWKVNDVVYANNELYFGGPSHFSKIKQDKLINICNWNNPKYLEFTSNLFDVLFDGNIYRLFLNKNKKHIEFESNASDYLDVRYNFLNNDFHVKLTNRANPCGQDYKENEEWGKNAYTIIKSVINKKEASNLHLIG